MTWLSWWDAADVAILSAGSRREDMTPARRGVGRLKRPRSDVDRPYAR